MFGDPGHLLSFETPGSQDTCPDIHLTSRTALPPLLTCYTLAPIPRIRIVLRGARGAFHCSVRFHVSAPEGTLHKQTRLPSAAALLGHGSERTSRLTGYLSQPQREPLFRLDCVYSPVVPGKHTSVSLLPWDVPLNNVWN